ncbi:MAG: peptide-methionine (S)-S-oxide reductase MsrA [Candidatus Puniceispirillaceae bacterium]
MLFSNPFKSRLPEPAEALPGRADPLWQPKPHAVHGRPILPPFPPAYKIITVGMGCFWGAERLFWQLDGVYTTAVGYAGGLTENPTYEEVCSGRTGHSEVVMICYDPQIISLPELLKIFYEEHDPTQGYRQGNDTGTQYRSVIFTDTQDDLEIARDCTKSYGLALAQAGKGSVTTEIASDKPFYYAEDDHQQYLHKVPHGYCGLKGTGVVCPIDKTQ